MGAFTFPLAALATAPMVTGGAFLGPGLGLTVLGIGVTPAILWWTLRCRPGGRLAAVTNAAET